MGFKSFHYFKSRTYQQFSLPAIKHGNKLPVVLNQAELRALINACDLLKHKLLISLCYGCGLRFAEVRQLKLGDVDTLRGMLHVRQGKGNKDRMLPMGTMLSRGISKYIAVEKPRTSYLRDTMGMLCLNGVHNGPYRRQLKNQAS